MPEAKKAVKTKVVNPKVVKAKPASTVKKAPTAKPKAISKAPKAVKPAVKPAVKAPAEVKARKVRGPNKIKAKGTFADLLKKQAELEQIKKGAKAELKKEFDALIKESDKIKAQYKELFSESIESAPKVRGVRVKKTGSKTPGVKPFTLKEVEDFVDQKKEGVDIKIKGRRPKSIEKLETAYKDTEDAEEILKILNQ